MSQQPPQDQTVVRESAKVLDRTTDLPDGPNVGPSPLEHLAAQGALPRAGGTPSASPLAEPGTPSRSRPPPTHDGGAGKEP